MRECSRENITSVELAQIASTDPTLAAEILRLVNAPFFGLSNEVRSVKHAISLLGQRTLYNLVLCIAVKDAFAAGNIPGLDTSLFWQDSLCRAVTARQLAKPLKLDLEECFTAGLLQDMGLLAMFYVQPEQAVHWRKLRQMDPDLRYEREREIFGQTHDEVILMLAQAWQLPEALSDALGQHHHCISEISANSNLELSRILYCADWIALVFSEIANAKLVDHCQTLLTDTFGLDEDAVETCFESIPEYVASAAQALGLRVASSADLQATLQEANLRLAEENLDYQELTWKLEKVLKERDQLAKELDKELALAREIQQSLLPSQADDCGLPVFGVNLSARQLSGDFYDYFALADGSIYFNLGDVSGKGFNAAILMAKVSSLFRCLGKQQSDPGKLLQWINQEICETSIRGMFVSMIAGRYEPRTGDVVLVNAGHPPALWLQPEHNLKEIDASAPPLGVEPDSTFPVETINLRNTSLCLFSDGITERKLSNGEMLGVHRLHRLLITHHELPMRKRLQAIIERLQSMPTPINDDMTLLLIEGQKT